MPQTLFSALKATSEKMGGGGGLVSAPSSPPPGGAEEQLQTAKPHSPLKVVTEQNGIQKTKSSFQAPEELSAGFSLIAASAGSVNETKAAGHDGAAARFSCHKLSLRAVPRLPDW